MNIEYETATLENFSELAYLMANPDVAWSVMNGQMGSAYIHLVNFGIGEGRKQVAVKTTQKDVDRYYLVNDVPQSDLASHKNQKRLIKSLIFPGCSVLEVGSRCVTSDSLWLREECQRIGAEYIGFDYYSGRNVDITGDAHNLYALIGRQFDIVYSSAVLEHIAMPWIVSKEIVRCMKVGGHIVVETHFSFSSHERPWHFFQFSDMGLRVLFPEAMGVKCIEAGLCNPIVGRFSAVADEYLRNRPVGGLYCHSDFYGVKVTEAEDFSWDAVDVGSIVSGTNYPEPK